MRNPRISIPLIYHLEPTTHAFRCTCGQLGNKPIPTSQFCSQTSSARGGLLTFCHSLRLASLHRNHSDSGSTSLGHRVEKLEEEKKEDVVAIQTFHHHVGANHTEENAMSAHSRVLSYNTQITKSRLAATENQVMVAT
ncbi:unnamed protein product [Lactuca saligna]|uniref:Uncharacterized protein n=1 Tax=Lactuca saligna TaxID=75948 RepID=A0AA35YX05_LACSI|nr:unnamed protein product [Lactuca saligna]